MTYLHCYRFSCLLGEVIVSEKSTSGFQLNVRNSSVSVLSILQLPLGEPVWKVRRVYFVSFLWEHLQRAGVRAASTGFPPSKSKSFHPVLSNLVNMLVDIISRPSSITSQTPSGTPELWPLNCLNLGFPAFLFTIYS